VEGVFSNFAITEFSEVHSQLARMLRGIKIVSKKRHTRPQDSSPAANMAGIRREGDANPHGSLIPLRKHPPRGIAWG
jgi:hypothetical protein